MGRSRIELTNFSFNFLFVENTLIVGFDRSQNIMWSYELSEFFFFFFTKKQSNSMPLPETIYKHMLKLNEIKAKLNVAPFFEVI